MDKVSIIIPAYNVEKYIGRCIESVIKQTYLNLEIIVVLDGIMDDTPNIIKEYEKKDARINVIVKDNGGLSSARNAGIKVATGDYIMFVDGDDYISDNCIEDTILMAKKENCDIVMFPYVRLYKNQYVRNLFDEEKIFSELQVKNVLLKKLIGPDNNEVKYLSQLDILNTAWGKLYRMENIKNIWFMDTKLIGPEDGWFNISVFGNCSKVAYIDTCMYYYEKKNENSILHTYDNDYYKKRKFFYRLVNEYMEVNNLNFKQNLYNRIVMEFFSILKKICNSQLSKKEKIKNVREILEDEEYNIAISMFDFEYLDIKGKIFWGCCKKKKCSILVQVMDLMLNLWRKK